MKKLFFTLLGLPLLAMRTFAGAPPHTDHYSVSPSDSKVQWFAEKVTGKHDGAISVKSGTISQNHGKLTGTVVIDMQSITAAGMGEEYGAKLEKHLSSEDFFGVEKHPTATFAISSVAPIANAAKGGNNFNVKGNLTIKGITNELAFPANIQFNESKMTIKGDATIDRSKYNVRYGSTSFFDELGDKAIYDEFKLVFDLSASK